MNLEELSKFSVGELRQKANDALKNLDQQILPDGSGTISGESDRSKVLSEAQFYIDEIERRKQKRIAFRDLFLELVVIMLISGELYYAIKGGNEQLKSLQTLGTSSEATAEILKTLRQEQEDTLDTQKETLQTITQMNAALQTELGLNYAPALTLVYSASEKMLVLRNSGKTNVFMWGDKFGELNPTMASSPRIITPGDGFKFSTDDIIKWQAEKIPHGKEDVLLYRVYLKTANGKKYCANYNIGLGWKGDVITVLRTQNIEVKPSWQ